MRRIWLFALTLLVACATATPSMSSRLDGNAAYPEGPLWRDGRLYVAEMGADRVSVYENGHKRTFFARGGCGPTALAPYGDGGFLILCHLEGAVVAIDRDAQVRFVRDRDSEGHRFRDPNDCYEDGQGGVYFSDPGLFSRDTVPVGAVMHIDAQGVVRRVATDLWYSNGVYTDIPRHLLYVSETFRRRVLRYPIAADGSLGQASVFFDVDASAPRQTRFSPPYREAGTDGLELAPNGEMFIAIYGEGRILRVSQDGHYLGQVELPTQYSTNIVFTPDGDAYTTGSFDNITPPFPGEVRAFPHLAPPP